MAIDIEKILNVDARTYVDCINKNLLKYDLVGVHCNKESIEEFAALVSSEAEVVVNYKKQFCGAGTGTGNRYRDGKTIFKYNQTGVALIPRKD